MSGTRVSALILLHSPARADAQAGGQLRRDQRAYADMYTARGPAAAPDVKPFFTA
jgi:hypothetical protein